MRGFVLAGALLAAVVASGCLESPRSTAQTTTTEQPSWNILVLGDSDATGMGDATGLGWAERYARLVRQRVAAQAEAKVVVTNLARSGQTSGELVSAVLSDPPTQGAVAEAQIVLIGIGGAAARIRGLSDHPPDPILRAITLPNVVPGANDALPAFITQRIGVSQRRALRRSICRAAELVLRTGLGEPS